jgi:hypothetical protein
MRGRKPQVEALPTIPGAILPPPPDLSPDAAEVWRELTASLPGDWFGRGEMSPILAALAHHVVFARRLAARIELMETALAALAADMTDVPDTERAKLIITTQRELRGTMRAHAQQTSMINALSRSLRLTKRSRYTRADEAAASGAQGAGRPWEDWAGFRREQ